MENAKIAQQLQERMDENRRVSGQLVQLASSVKVREAIYRSHMEASGGEINPAQQARKPSLCLFARGPLMELCLDLRWTNEERGTTVCGRCTGL